ncbi:MAG TPA: hypothetical protein VI386_03335 [Candidatus Sulfotelmatobacter sp.]
MKKQASDQQFHDRRHQERKRAEAARKVVKKPAGNDSAPSSETKPVATAKPPQEKEK